MTEQNKNKRSFHSYVSNNFILKIISLIFAIILWSFVTNSTNPDRVKTIREVPVVLQGLEALEEKGLTIRDDLEKVLPTVTVKVNVKNSDYRRINKKVIFVSVDVSEIINDGPNSVSVVPSISNMVDASLISIEPQAINITIDKLLEKEVPVTINKIGSLASSLVSVNPEYNKTVLIRGSSYYVERISNAVVDVDLSTLKDGDVVNSLCNFTDSEGNAINFDSTRINVDLDIQTKKEVNISTKDAILNSDKLKEGYEFGGVSAGKITICGHSDVLQNVNEIKIKPIDLTDKDASFTTTPVEFILPEGITVLTGQDPHIKVQIAPKKKVVTINRAITISGLNTSATIKSGDQTFTVEENGITQIIASVTLTGSDIVIDNVTADDVIVNLSLENKGAGAYQIIPTIQLSSAIADDVTAQFTSPTIFLVTIS